MATKITAGIRDTDAEHAAEKLRAIVLYSIASRNVFSDKNSQDFYANLLPFFEPFVAARRKKVFSVAEMMDYSRRELLLPISDDIAALFISKMVNIGWLSPEARGEDSSLYRCVYNEQVVNDETLVEIERELSRLIQALRKFLLDVEAPFEQLSDRQLEDVFLKFLVSQMGSGGESPSESESSPTDRPNDVRIEYWIARFISHCAMREPDKFKIIQKLGGIALVSEALVELRSPTFGGKSKKDLFLYIDGPLLMDYMGLSGKRHKENAGFVIDRMREMGFQFGCFRHTCDEVRDNLFGVLQRSPAERTGPTGIALNAKEVREDFVSLVCGNVEHYVKELTRITVFPQRKEQFKHQDKFMPDSVYFRLSERMPSQTPVARERDAESIAIVMRRRAGHESNNVFESKFILLTSNPRLVAGANEILREHRVMTQSRAIVGPAVHQRVLAGLLFANFGVADRTEASRRQLLAACARVVALRPRVLERVRQQVGLLKSQEERAIFDALVIQPRASEVLMDYAVGQGKTISPENIDEVLQAVRRTAAEEVRSALEEKHADEIEKIREEERLAAAKYEEQLANVVEKVNQIGGELDRISKERAQLQESELQTRLRLQAAAEAIARRTLQNVIRVEGFLAAIFGLLCVSIFLVPLFLKPGILASAVAAVGALLSGLGFVLVLMNRQFKRIEVLLTQFCEKKIRSILGAHGFVEQAERVRVDFKARQVHFLEPPTS